MVRHPITGKYKSQDAARLLVWLIGVEVFFAAAHLFIFVGPGVPWDIVRKLLDLDREVALTTWFATVQLFSIGAVLLITAWANNDTDHSLSTTLVLAGLLFLFLSADEGGGIHEGITQIVEKRGFSSLLFPGNHGGWIAVYAIGGVVFLLIAGSYLQRPLQIIWHRFPWESLLVIGGFAVMVLGGVGFEVISYYVLRSGSTPELYQLEVAIEEFLEMAGASVILYATLEIAATLCSEETHQPSSSDPYAASRSRSL